MQLRPQRVASALLAALLFFPPAAALIGAQSAFAAQNATAPEAHDPPGTHKLNLKDADIQVLIATVAEITGKNFIVGPNVQGKVTVISTTPQKADEIYKTFRRHPAPARLRRDSVWQHDQDRARSRWRSRMAPVGLGASAGAEADELVTQIIPLRHLPATELVPILRPLMPQGAQLIAHPGSNSLVVSDRAGNVARIASIVQRIDTVSDSQVEMIPLQHASAAEIARTLAQLNDNKGADADRRGREGVRRPAHQFAAAVRRQERPLAHARADRASRHAARERRRYERRLSALCEREGSRADPARHLRDAERRSRSGRGQAANAQGGSGTGRRPATGTASRRSRRTRTPMH